MTPADVNQLIANAELRGDWDELEVLKVLRDKLIHLEGQNQAYRHALGHGVTINMIGKRRWFKH